MVVHDHVRCVILLLMAAKYPSQGRDYAQYADFSADVAESYANVALLQCGR